MAGSRTQDLAEIAHLPQGCFGLGQKKLKQRHIPILNLKDAQDRLTQVVRHILGGMLPRSGRMHHSCMRLHMPTGSAAAAGVGGPGRMQDDAVATVGGIMDGVVERACSKHHQP